MVLPVGFCSAFCGVNTSAQAGIAPCLQRGSSHLVSPHSPASRVLLWRPALRPGLGLPEAPAGLSVPESLGDKHIFKGDTGAQRPLPEGGANVPPSWERTWPCAPMFRFSRGQLVCLYLSPSSAQSSGGGPRDASGVSPSAFKGPGQQRANGSRREQRDHRLCPDAPRTPRFTCVQGTRHRNRLNVYGAGRPATQAGPSVPGGPADRLVLSRGQSGGRDCRWGEASGCDHGRQADERK